MSIQARKLIPTIAALYVISLLVVANPSAAQTSKVGVKVTFDDAKSDFSQMIEGRLPPESATTKLAVKTTVAVPQAEGCIRTLNVKYTVTSPAYSAAIINPETDSKTITYAKVGGTVDTPTNPSAPAEVVFDSVLTISLKRAAPALEDGKYIVKADVTIATSTGCTLLGETGTGSTNVKNDYISIMQYTPSNQIQKTGQNKGVNFNIKLTNLGNGPTKVTIKVDNPGKSKLDSYLAPAQQKLESKQTQGPAAKFEQDIQVQARTPHQNGYTNSFYSLMVTFDASYDGVIKNGAADSQTIPLSIQVQGVYVPGPDFGGLVGTIGLALGLLALGRRRA